MPTTLLVRLRVRRDTYTNLDATNRVYGRGEVVYDETNDKFKVGDGITAWRLLPYTGADAALSTLSDVQLNLPLANGQALTWNSTAGKWVNATVGISDGDKGDITVSNSGGTWTIDNGAIGTAKLGGDITPAGKALLDDADAAAQRTTLGLGTASTQNVPASGNAASTEVVLGNDSRLSDARTPTAHTHAIADVTSLQTALDGKAALAHTHAIADVTGLQAALDAAQTTLTKTVRNDTASTMTKGQVVYIFGSSGTHLLVRLADADLESTAAPTIGVVQANIAPNGDGTIVVAGYLEGLSNLPTGSFANGAALWLSQTAGGWTTTPPTQPAHRVFLGWVVTNSPGAAGRAYIKVINGEELEELHDVLISGVADGHILQYDTGLWRNRNLAAAGVAAASHVHGNITNGGLIGTTANLPIITGTGGLLQAGSFGTGASTFCEGNDSRLSNSRAPTGSASGDLSGTYPAPTVAQLQGRAVSSAAPSNGQGLVWSNANSRWEPTTLGSGSGTVTQVSSGTGLSGGPITTSGTLSVDFAASGVSSATQAVRADDSRLSDARTPLSHAHGNITNAGAIGTTANLPIVTGTGGILQTGTLGSNLSLTGGTLAVTASGSTTQVQFNDGGTTLGGDSGLTYDKLTSSLTVTGDLAVNGGDITSTSASFYIAAAATDVRIAAGAASAPTIRLGTNITGNTVTLNGIAAGTSNLGVNVSTGIVNLFTGITTGTLNVATGGASTINLGGTAASVNIGTTSGNSTLTIQANSTTGTATVATSAGVTTGNLFNTVVTSLNVGGAATSLTLGATTGTAALRNPTLRLGNTTSSIATNSGTTNSLTLAPFGSLTIAPATSAGSLGGTLAQLQVTNAVDGAGQVRVTGGNLYLGTYSTDGLGSLDVGILFEGATANSFTTRLQAADPGANRTITLPNASGTVALIAGSSNQVQYNSSGALAGSSAFTFDGSHLQVGSQGQVRLGSSAATYVALRSPATVANSNIYTLPAAVGSANQVLQIDSVSGNDATLKWATVSGGGGGVSDADYGDIVVSGSSTVWTIDNDAVTYAKMQNVSATDRLLGRSTTGAGDVEEIVCTAYARSVLDDADAATARTTLGLGTTDTPQFAGISLASGEFLSNASDGRIDIGPNGTHPSQPSSDYYALTVDGQSWGFGVRIGTRNTRTDTLNTSSSLNFLVPVVLNNDTRFAFGSSQNYFIRHVSGSSRAGVACGLLVNNAGSTGSLVIAQGNEVDNANRIPATAHAHPTLYLYGNGSANANDFVRLSHDTTNATVEAGRGNLNLEAAGDIMNKGNRIPKVFSGTSVPSNALGGDGDVYFKY
jgi:hypothetical protein